MERNIECHSGNINFRLERNVKLLINEDSLKVNEVICSSYKRRENKFSCCHYEYIKECNDGRNLRKCLFEDLSVAQLDLYEKSDYHQKSLMNRCDHCHNLTLSTIYEEKSSHKIPEGLTIGEYYSGDGKLVNLVLCAECDKKMNKELSLIYNKYKSSLK